MRNYKLIGGPCDGEYHNVPDGLEYIIITTPCDDDPTECSNHEYFNNLINKSRGVK